MSLEYHWIHMLDSFYKTVDARQQFVKRGALMKHQRHITLLSLTEPLEFVDVENFRFSSPKYEWNSVPAVSRPASFNVRLKDVSYDSRNPWAVRFSPLPRPARTVHPLLSDPPSALIYSS